MNPILRSAASHRHWSDDRKLHGDFLVLANPVSRSVCGEPVRRAISTLMAGEIRILDLYADEFDPMSLSSRVPRAVGCAFRADDRARASGANGRADDGCRQAASGAQWSDRLLLVFRPLWWRSMPVVREGWIDRVFSADFAYGSKDVAGRLSILCAPAETKTELFSRPTAATRLTHRERHPQILRISRGGVVWRCGHSRPAAARSRQNACRFRRFERRRAWPWWALPVDK